MEHGVPTGVGLHAVGAAAVRAAESRRRDRLFADPLAAAFVAAAGRPWRFPAKDEASAAPFWATMVDALVIRTRFFDEYLAGALAAGIRQVVVLAAGLDARAYRLRCPRGTRLWELDLPDVVAFKEQVLIATAARPGCARLALHADLREDWPARLRAAGFRDDEPTAWLAEGLLVFLGPAENDRLLGRIGVLSAPRSRLGLSVTSQALFDSLTARTTLDALGDYSTTVGSQWRSAFAVQPGHWLDAHGWRSRAYDPAERARVYGRRTADLTGPHIGGRLGWLAVAERA